MARFYRLPAHALPLASHCSNLLARGRRIMKPSPALRFVLAATLIALTALLLQARGRGEFVPKHLPLSAFPAQLANWNSTLLEQDPKTLEVLGPGDFMERVYRDPSGKLPPVDVFIAYFP